MIKNLVIVESPTKAKTIQKYLGETFEVVSSFGHIVDLPKKQLGIDIKNNFQPTYVVIKNKKKIIEKLQKLSEKSDIVWLATDEDREGEAISWHLYKELNISNKKLRRIVFHEITKNAILQSIKNSRLINYNLVHAQQARRILDRLVGFELSPVLWSKIKRGLSAGRVQSVALRLIVEREKEIQQFLSTSFYKISANFISNNKEIFEAKYQEKISSKKEVELILRNCVNEISIINKIEIKLIKKKPLSPFTTSSLQQEASKKLNYSIAYTMRIAQQLYEKGYITYMRTDSINISEEAVMEIKKEIIILYGVKYSQPRKYITKKKFVQEAHEAIRPTDISKTILSVSIPEQNLYKLIWERTITGQMADAILEETKININTAKKYDFITKKEFLIFDGFLKAFYENKENNKEKSCFSKFNKNDIIKNNNFFAVQYFTKHPSRYNESTLVKKLENLGIGRPSTYVPIISTIQKRKYIEIEDLKKTEELYEVLTFKEGQIFSVQEKKNVQFSKKNFIPTDIGIIVNDFLVQYFKQVLDYNFTAKVEELFDEIARGEKIWTNIIKNFYDNFHSKIENVSKNIKRTTGERLLGFDPQSEKKVWAKIGKFGPMIQIGEAKDAKKPKFASLLKHQKINSISLEEALNLFKLPRSLGIFNEKEIIINIGKFGAYIKYGEQFISIKKYENYNPLEINLEQAIQVIEEKIEENQKKIIKRFESINPPIEILNGQFGAYIRQGKKNYKILKKFKFKNLTLENCQEIITNYKNKKF